VYKRQAVATGVSPTTVQEGMGRTVTTVSF